MAQVLDEIGGAAGVAVDTQPGGCIFRGADEERAHAVPAVRSEQQVEAAEQHEWIGGDDFVRRQETSAATL